MQTALPIKKEELKPPVINVGMIGWLRYNLFSSIFNSILTILIVLFLIKIVPPLIQWAFIDSVWQTASAGCKDAAGACWSVVSSNIRFILFGLYPYAQHWRPLIAMIILFGLLFYTQNRKHWKKNLISMWIAGLIVMGLLMKGVPECSKWVSNLLSFFGLTTVYKNFMLLLPSVESTQWGGLPLTLLLAFFGLTAAYPLGVLLALGRQSKMPMIKWLCIFYIELIRGVPLISLLFMSSIVFPLFLPEGVNLNKILRAQAAIIFFTAAYIAEVVRGGLQGMTRGQYEAAQAIGLNYYQTMRLIVLPQALKMVIPPSVSILISAFKDTSLVMIIALYDLLKTTKTVISNPNWMGFSREAYIFVALLYFLGCFSMSSYSRKLEKELSQGE
jgi:general L-amino acid transport system permease protein